MLKRKSFMVFMSIKYMKFHKRGYLFRENKDYSTFESISFAQFLHNYNSSYHISDSTNFLLLSGVTPFSFYENGSFTKVIFHCYVM